MKHDRIYLLGFMLVNLILKCLLININGGEYTDGILQLLVFENKSGLYPPLYGGLSALIGFLGIEAETAGKIVSILASVLTLVPIFYLARYLAGNTAARFALLLFSVSALQWRWSLRVMTDSLFLLLSTSALYYLVKSVGGLRELSDRTDRAGSTRLLLDLDKTVAGAILFSALATLTRYQGIIFLPVVGILFLWYFVKRLTNAKSLGVSNLPVFSLISVMSWVAVPLWMYFHGFVHQEQFSERAVQDTWGMALAWWNTFESFILISPYYLGYPLVLLSCAAFRHTGGSVERQRRNAFLIVSAVFGLLLLVLHSAFGSFQYRYMMPLLPVFCILGGIGAVVLEDYFRLRDKPKIFSFLIIVSVCYLAFQSLAVVFLQSQTFADQKQAAEKIRSLPIDTSVYSNELYGSFENLRSLKLSYWSGRKVGSIYDSNQSDGIRLFNDGDVIILGTHYGGDDAVRELFHILDSRYRLTPMLPQSLVSVITPVHDDIMSNPMFNQNPTMWVMRYIPQRFSTQIFVVNGKK